MREMRTVEIKTNLTREEWLELINLGKEHFQNKDLKIIYKKW